MEETVFNFVKNPNMKSVFNDITDIAKRYMKALTSRLALDELNEAEFISDKEGSLSKTITETNCNADVKLAKEI